jgi:hypothetical protein
MRRAEEEIGDGRIEVVSEPPHHHSGNGKLENAERFIAVALFNMAPMGNPGQPTLAIEAPVSCSALRGVEVMA